MILSGYAFAVFKNDGIYSHTIRDFSDVSHTVKHAATRDICPYYDLFAFSSQLQLQNYVKDMSSFGLI